MLWEIIEPLDAIMLRVKCTTCNAVLERTKYSLKHKHRCSSIRENSKYCYKCKIRKELTAFHKDSTVYGGYHKICKECYSCSPQVKNRKQKKKDDISFYFRQKLNNIRHRCKKEKIPFDLTVEYLNDLWTRQEGKCFYFKDDMQISCEPTHRKFSVSVDRLTPELGYVKNNIVLCCLWANAMKSDRTEKEFKLYVRDLIQRFQKYVNAV